MLGVSVAGALPILLPLAVGTQGTIADVGLVMAAFNLGGLASPLWGKLADRYRLHRVILAFGLLLSAISIALFPATSSLTSRAILALLQGTGAAAAATVANLFIVELHPEEEWDKRIGWLQSFYGGGQVIGLVLAGFLTTVSVRLGLLTTAGVTAVAFIPGWFMTPSLPRDRSHRPVLRHPARHAEVHAGSPQRFYHLPSISAIRRLLGLLFTPFGFFITAWLISFMGAAAFFSLYPVLMKTAYGVAPAAASVGFAVSAMLGLALYPLAGNWSARLGSVRLLQIGFGIRILAFLGFLSIGFANGTTHPGLALFNFLFIVLAWSLLSVAGTEMTSELSRSNEGEGLGLYNAATSIAGVLGAVLGGALADRFGYSAIQIFALISIGLGLVIVTLIPTVAQKESILENNIKVQG